MNVSRVNWSDQRGITGLETAIVLIAFVVVASVFAFAILSAGFVASEKSRQTVVGALKEASATLLVRGGVIGRSNAGLTGLDDVRFTLGNASGSYASVEVSSSATILTYVDEDQALNIANNDWTATWLIGSGPILDPGEQVDVVATLSGLTPLLGPKLIPR